MSLSGGCRRPDPEKLASHPHASAHPQVAARLTAASLPPDADKLPETLIVDQGQEGDCTAASDAASTWTALAAKGTPLPFFPSQRLLYAVTRAIERAAAAAGRTLPELSDTGADMEDVFTAEAEYGVAPMVVDQSPDGRFSDIWGPDDGPAAPNLNGEAELAALFTAATTLIKLDVHAHVIPVDDPNRSDLMAAALDADPPIPIQACGPVGAAFQSMQPGQVLGPTPASDKTQGGHAFYFRAYRTNANGEREWLLRNSYGPQWCEAGGCWVSEAFIASCWGLWVKDVTVQKDAA